MRERMVQHRSNPVCAGCHQVMDPVGLSVENFDAIGRWRDRGDGGTTMDVSGGLPDGSTFDGVAGLQAGGAEAAGPVCLDAHRQTDDLCAGSRD